MKRKAQKSKAARKGKALNQAELKKVSGGRYIWGGTRKGLGASRNGDNARADEWSDQGL